MKLNTVLAAAFILAFAAMTTAQETRDRPLITVTGQAEVLAVPDEVVFNLNAVTVDKDLLAAQRKNDEVVRNVLALARRYDIPANQVQTGHISLEEKYSDEEATRKPRVFIGYEVRKGIAVTLRDVTKAEPLLSDIFRSGITRITSVEFRTTQSRSLRDQARAMAMKAAQEKAAAMAKEIGQSIGKAFSITEQGMEPYRGGLSNNVTNLSGFYVPPGPDEPSTIALGQITITARVIVSFELK